MENYVACYRQDVFYFEITFSYTVLPIYAEPGMNMGIQIVIGSSASSFPEFPSNMESATSEKVSTTRKFFKKVGQKNMLLF